MRNTLILCLMAFMMFNTLKSQPLVSGTVFSDYEVMVAFEPGTTDAEIITYADTALNGNVIAISPWSRVALIQVDGSVPVPDLVGIIEGSNPSQTGSAGQADIVVGGGVNYVFGIPPLDPATKPQTDFYPSSCPAGTVNLTAGANVVKIAILDTGVDGQYDKQSDQFIFNHGEFNNHFYSSVGYDIVNNDFYPEDEHGHGTHIAGIIDYVAPTSNIKFMSFKTFNENGGGSLFNVILGMDAAVLNGANIINCSYRFYLNPNFTHAYEHVLELIEQENILIVAGIGNESNFIDDFEPSLPFNLSVTHTGTPAPSAYEQDNILSVASYDCQKSLSSFSNYGPSTTDICAPGESVRSFGLNGSYARFSDGTSQATAFVTGVAALLGSHQAQFNALEIKCAIMSSAENYDFPLVSGGAIHPQDAYVALSSGCTAYGQKEKNITGFDMNRTTLESNKTTSTSLELYPNPTQGGLNLKILSETNLDAQIQILQSNGHPVYEVTKVLYKGINPIPIDIENIPTGIYFIQVKTSIDRTVLKFIKE